MAAVGGVDAVDGEVGGDARAGMAANRLAWARYKQSLARGLCVALLLLLLLLLTAYTERTHTLTAHTDRAH
jgi:hypothetical protein